MAKRKSSKKSSNLKLPDLKFNSKTLLKKLKDGDNLLRKKGQPILFLVIIGWVLLQFSSKNIIPLIFYLVLSMVIFYTSGRDMFSSWVYPFFIILVLSLVMGIFNGNLEGFVNKKYVTNRDIYMWTVTNLEEDGEYTNYIQEIGDKGSLSLHLTEIFSMPKDNKNFDSELIDNYMAYLTEIDNLDRTGDEYKNNKEEVDYVQENIIGKMKTHFAKLDKVMETSKEETKKVDKRKKQVSKKEEVKEVELEEDEELVEEEEGDLELDTSDEKIVEALTKLMTSKR